jgi:hypothetical protein
MKWWKRTYCRSRSHLFGKGNPTRPLFAPQQAARDWPSAVHTDIYHFRAIDLALVQLPNVHQMSQIFAASVKRFRRSPQALVGVSLTDFGTKSNPFAPASLVLWTDACGCTECNSHVARCEIVIPMPRKTCLGRTKMRTAQSAEILSVSLWFGFLGRRVAKSSKELCSATHSLNIQVRSQRALVCL